MLLNQAVGRALLVSALDASTKFVASRSSLSRACSESCLHGMCAAHWVAFQTAAQSLGGLAAPGCAAVVGQFVTDLHSLAIMCQHLLMVPEFTALFSEAIGQMGLDMLQVRLHALYSQLQGCAAPNLHHCGCANMSPSVLAAMQSADVTELVADVADTSPQLAAAMARGGTLQALVEGARRLLGSGDASGVRHGGGVWGWLLAAGSL